MSDSGVGRNVVSGLCLADAENLGPADGAGTLDRRTAILKDDVSGVSDLPLRPALEAISLHKVTSSYLVESPYNG